MIDQASLGWEEKLTPLLQPDTLLTAQYSQIVGKKTHLEPEKKLMLAVLEDAILCFQDNVCAQSGAKRKLFEQADAWIAEANGGWIFSFDSICEVLGFDPAYVRQGLWQWKEKRLVKHPDAMDRSRRR